jgi:hypothetical protein
MSESKECPTCKVTPVDLMKCLYDFGKDFGFTEEEIKNELENFKNAMSSGKDAGEYIAEVYQKYGDKFLSVVKKCGELRNKQG